MIKSFICLLIIIVFVNTVTQSQSIKISGKLFDKDNGKTIYSGIIFLNPGKLPSVTNDKGEFSFTTSSGTCQILTQVMGYKSSIINFEAISDTIINIYLQVSPVSLDEVTITGDSTKNVIITPHGSIVLTPAALNETPKLFSEPDLVKFLQLLPGVVSGKEGTSDFYVRGGGPGQNIAIADGCYFFLPSHLLGILSPYDLDFLESAELFKDYVPSDIGGGAASVLNLEFRKVHSDSLRANLRLGILSSGFTFETPFGKTNWHISAGIKRGNYSLYAPVLKKLVQKDVESFLPPNKYSFYDGFISISNNSPSVGKLSYLYFGNYDNGKDENKTTGQNGDTLTRYVDGMASGWTSMVHALQWEPPVRGTLKWKINLNYNQLTIGRKLYSESETYLNNSQLLNSASTKLSFYPSIRNLGLSTEVTKEVDNFTFSAGLSERYRLFSSDNYAENIIDGKVIQNNLSENNNINEISLYFSSVSLIAKMIQVDFGMRFNGSVIKDSKFLIAEPRFRASYNPGGLISPHINYVRLSQNDHAIEGSGAGLRTMLWLPLYKDFGPEVSDVLSAGLQFQRNKDFVWTFDAYYKKSFGMVDFKPGSSFIYDTSFVDLMDKIRGKAYGIETSVIKRTGKLTGSASYTYSRSKREWFAPEGVIWIPSLSDRPHSFNVNLKYYISKRISFGTTFVYQSGAPATIYMHETSYGEFFETKNNIRYFNYHRLDLSFRYIIPKDKFTFFLDADIYNVYNHNNTFYFKKVYDETEQRYYFKNISLFPIMPSLTLTIKY